MRNQWTNFYTGYVQVKAKGITVENFVNALVRNNIHIWNMKRESENAVTFYISLNNVNRMRRIVRRHPCKVYFKKRAGLPFLTKRLLLNSGFLLGFILFLTGLFLLSNVVWNIEVTGAKPETEHQIRKELKAMGVEIGKFQFFIDGSDEIQRNLSHEIDAITWVGVELRGTTFHLQVVEKKEPEIVSKVDKQNLVATKKAVIRRIFVEKGKAAVEVNDYVKKGQLLVSSNISNGENSEFVSAKGVVLGETWYKSTVEIPLVSKFHVYSGIEETKHYVRVNKLSLPIWGFGKTTIADYETDETDRPLYFLGYKLPISYKSVTYRDKETVTREYSKKEAIEKGREIGSNDLKKILPVESKIIGEKILHERFEHGKVVLSIHYQVLENIAIERPIVQGD
ncbi:MAG: sporulation protein YqfD [Bacillus sp. (in: firmicutes)]